MSDLTEAIDGICRLLTTDPSAAAVARELGDVVEEQVAAIEVRARDERFGDVYVVHDDDGAVLNVDLDLREPSSLEELGQAFGEYREGRRRHPAPRSFNFTVPGCTVIASVKNDRVSRVTVRRDA